MEDKSGTIVQFADVHLNLTNRYWLMVCNLCYQSKLSHHSPQSVFTRSGTCPKTRTSMYWAKLTVRLGVDIASVAYARPRL